jgi:MscS family membrane protein
MSLRACLFILMVCSPGVLPGAQGSPAAKGDTLDRGNPRSSVTAFLEACRDQDYRRASEYLDLRHLSSEKRASQGPALAKGLEAILNADPQFSVLRLSRDPQGDLSDDSDSTREHAATVEQAGKSVTLDLERVTLQAGSAPVWLFSSDTVVAIPKLTPSAAPPAIARYLPAFMLSVTLLETPLWMWLALMLAALVLISLSHLLDRLLSRFVKGMENRLSRSMRLPITGIVIQPLRAILLLAVFRAAVQLIDPSAIARLYIGRGIELVLIWVIARFLIGLVGLLIEHVEVVLDSRQQYASRSMLHLARRAANVTIVVFAILLVLSNWGYNTATLVAGLGVGGIAVALAAQQTIANVFGGVSIIGDQPVRIGDLGKFGDLIGKVEDIGMRSTRIRTPGRTVVSIPNSNFAGLNIENYSMRDKILFNTTLTVNRSTEEGQLREVMKAIQQKLATHKSVEAGQQIVRPIGLTAAGVNLEIFCYVLTSNWDEFYKIQGDLLLAINEALKSGKVELV